MSGNPPTIRCSNLVDQFGRPMPKASSSMTHAHEAASTSRRMSTWGLGNFGPNDSVISGLSNVRARSREVRRNNPWIDGGVDTFIAYLVGTSISPRWKIEDKTLRDDIHGEWSESVKEMDYDGIYSFYGLQELISHGLVESGEALYRKRIVAEEELRVPFQIQAFEPDLLDHSYTMPLPNGNEIRFGIEFNKREKRVAYHLYREHPGESFGFLSSFAGDRIPIPAKEIGHVFRPLRPRQMRGFPWLKSVITRVYELDKCEDAELVRRVMAGMFVGAAIKPSGEDGESSLMGRRLGSDPRGNPVVGMEPGTMAEYPPGYNIIFSKPPDAGQGFFDLTKHHLRAIAKGSRNTYDKMTGDLSEVNFSSIRAGQNDLLQLVRQIQFHTLIFQLCEPVATAWMDLAIASGRLKIRDYAENKRKYQQRDWVPDAPKYVNPLQDIQADILEVRAGFKSRPQKIAERGGDVEKVNAGILEDKEWLDREELVLDTDPRRTAKSGIIQDMEQLPNGGSN